MHEPAAEFHYDARGALRSLPGFVILTLIGIYLLTPSIQGIPDRAISIGFAGAIFTVLGFFGIVEHMKRWRDKSVVLRIGPQGIVDSRLGGQLIRWEQVIAIDERETWGRNSMPYLDIRLDKSARVDGGWMTIFWRIAGARGLPITPEGLEGTLHSVFRSAKHFADERGIPFNNRI